MSTFSFIEKTLLSLSLFMGALGALAIHDGLWMTGFAALCFAFGFGRGFWILWRD